MDTFHAAKVSNILQPFHSYEEILWWYENLIEIWSFSIWLNQQLQNAANFINSMSS